MRLWIAPHGRQLGAVADQDQPARPAAAHIFDQIRKQRTAAEQRPLGTPVGEHRGLVDDEDRTAFGIEVQREFRLVVGIRALPVDAFVDRQGLLSGVAREHLGGASRGGQKN